MSRVAVVTGVGMCTPLGIDRESSWAGFLAGRSGIGPIRAYDASDLPVGLAGEIPGDLDEVFKARVKLPFPDRYARFTKLALLAGGEALEHAGLDVNEADAASAVDPTRVGVCLGVGGGPLHFMSDFDRAIRAGGDGLEQIIDHNFVLRYMGNAAAAQLGIWKKLQGPTMAVNAACASGGQAIEVALDLLRSGRCDVVLAGGTDATVTRQVIHAYHRAGALTTSTERGAAASRPFDRQRDGFVMAEGAGVLVLETEEHAARRGAPTLARLAGSASTGEAYNIVAPRKDGSGMLRTMRAALADAGLDAKALGWVCAHGTSTPLNDPIESRAIRALLGDRADRVGVSSLKSMMGHAIGATCAIEAAACVLALRDQAIPPTLHLDEPDEGCDLDYVTGAARRGPLEAVASNAFGFGGHDNTLVFTR